LTRFLTKKGTRETACFASSVQSKGLLQLNVKDDLIQRLYDQSGFSKHKSREVVETVFELVKRTLESGEDVLLSGKFSVKAKSPRRGRNPATGDDLTLDARRVVNFKCSGILREKINGKG
jgi:integration host factor subunit alpha